MKDRVLVFNGYYFPAKNYGGPATSIENMVEACSDALEFFIIVVNHDFGATEKFTSIREGWNERGKAKVLYVDDDQFTVKNIAAWIDEVKPVSIYLGGVLSIRNIRYVLAAKRKKVKIIVPPRGEVLDNAVKRKRFKKLAFFSFLRLFDVYKHCYFHATSEAERNGIIKYLGVSANQIILLPNIPKQVAEGHIIEKTAGTLNAVYIARICKTKNLLEAIGSLTHVKGRVHYRIYGPMEDEQYWSECEAVIKTVPPTVNIEYMGALDSNLVGDVYRQSDCTILPTVTENYGHSIAESLVAGCPCIIPQGTTPWDSIDLQAGFTYPLGNETRLAEIIQKMVDMDQKEYSELIQSTYAYARDRISSVSLIKDYTKMFRNQGETF